MHSWGSKPTTLPLALLRPVVALLFALSCGCLSDEALHIECSLDSDCPIGSTCRARLCVAPRDVDTSDSGVDSGATPIECDAGLSPCGQECVDLNRSAQHCGECGASCEPGPNESAVCASGDCVRTCEPEFWNLEEDAPGCEYACRRTSPSSEACDGVDNDCNGLIDAEDPQLQSPACTNQDGVCDGSRRRCVDGVPRPCGPEDYAAHADTYDPNDELRCDGEDNDCDGRVDEHCCDGGDLPYAVLGEGEAWAVAGFWTSGDDLRLTALDTLNSEAVTWSIPRFAGAEIVETGEMSICPASFLNDAVYVDARRSIVAVCSESRSGGGVYAQAGDAFDGYFQLDVGEFATATSASSRGNVIDAAFATRAADGSQGTLLVHDDGDSIVSARFSPPADEHEAAAVATLEGTRVVPFALREAGEVRVQHVDDALVPTGFSHVIGRDLDWAAAEPIAIAAVAISDTAAVIAYSIGTSVVVVRWNAEGETDEAMGTLDSGAVQRIWLQRSSDRLWLTAVRDSDIAVWALDMTGALRRNWILSMRETTRTDMSGDLAARVVTAVQGDIAYIAYGSPWDAAGLQDGLVLHRLGIDSDPLCR